MDTRTDTLSAGRARAIEGQQRRAELLAQLRAGRISLTDVFDQDDKAAQQIAIGSLLRSVPRIGRLKAAVLLAAAEVDETRRLIGLSPQERRRIAAAVAVLPAPGRQTA